MENITVATQGTKLILTIETAVQGSPSSTGKTNVLASTRGNKRIVVAGKEVSIGVNAYTAR